MTAPRIESARLRRVPRYGVFLGLGALLGVVLALILTFAFDDGVRESITGVTYPTSQVFGFLCLFCVPVGLVIGGGIALILDRMLARRGRDVRIARDRVLIDPDED